MKKYHRQSPCVYYVNPFLCDGRSCRYTGIKIIDYAEIVANTDWTLKVTLGDDSEIFDYEDVGTPASNLDLATNLQKSIITWITDDLEKRALDTLDIIVVHKDPDGDYPGRTVIYFRHKYSTVLTDNDPLTEMDYLRDEGNVADIYHLCRNISYNFGECRESDDEFAKRSNIYCEQNAGVWSNAGIPIIMANCQLCDYCITKCPRKAIHNKIDGSPKTLTELGTGDEVPGMFAEQYYKNAQSKPGKDIY